MIWLLLLRDNAKEVNRRRQAFVSNVGRGGEMHVRGLMALHKSGNMMWLRERSE